MIGSYKRMDKTIYHQTAWQKVDNENLYLVKHSDIIKVPLGSESDLEIVQTPNYWKVCLYYHNFHPITSFVIVISYAKISNVSL